MRTANGGDNGVRLLDVNNDGFMDVVIGNQKVRMTRVWLPEKSEWMTCEFPAEIVQAGTQGEMLPVGVRFGILQTNGYASVLVRNKDIEGLWHFDGQQWVAVPHAMSGLAANEPVSTAIDGIDCGLRLRDLDQDGCCEVIVGHPDCQAVFAWSANESSFHRLPFTLPEDVLIVDKQGRDAGLRFVDLDADQHDDIVFSDGKRYSVHRFSSMEQGWSQPGISGRRVAASGIPPIVADDGTNNGVWFKFGHMWIQNEQTGIQLPQHCDRVEYAQLLGKDPKADAQSY